MLNLKSIRKQKGITQKILSSMSGISQPYISQIEKDGYDCTLGTVLALCKALEVTPNDLIKSKYYK